MEVLINDAEVLLFNRRNPVFIPKNTDLLK